jgi:hypothetical protein
VGGINELKIWQKHSVSPLGLFFSIHFKIGFKGSEGEGERLLFIG